MRLSRVLLLGSLATTGLAAQAGAQVTGLPVHNGGISRGLTIGAEAGFPNAAYGKGTAFGGRAALGLGSFGVSGVIASYNPRGPGGSQTGVGGYLDFKVFGGPLIPLSVTLQGGAEYMKQRGVKVLHSPIGLGIALKIPNPALAIKPWIAPRVDVVRVSGSGISTNTTTKFGISGGIDFSLLGGIGFGVAYDRTSRDGGGHPSVFSVGVNYTLKLPGL